LRCRHCAPNHHPPSSDTFWQGGSVPSNIGAVETGGIRRSACACRVAAETVIAEMLPQVLDPPLNEVLPGEIKPQCATKKRRLQNDAGCADAFREFPSTSPICRP
jgi:hypothetical protein